MSRFYVKVAAAVTAVALVALGVYKLFDSYQQVDTRTVTICEKESVAKDGGHEYRVYTSDGTYVVKDHWIHGGRFNTADIYARIQTGDVYELETYGWRIGLFSSFENILSAEPVSNATPAGCEGWQ